MQRLRNYYGRVCGIIQKYEKKRVCGIMRNYYKRIDVTLRKSESQHYGIEGFSQDFGVECKFTVSNVMYIFVHYRKITAFDANPFKLPLDLPLYKKGAVKLHVS